MSRAGEETAARRLEAERRATNERQARAADPAISAWVSANAGTGKTHVLTTRVLRLLLAGTPPEQLLCLTYTKAAASVMSNRVFQRLAAWVTADDAALDGELAALLGRAADEAEQGRARDLFTRAIETPGGLKVQTIHAFCERLLQRFPLEANVPPGFAILDDKMRDGLIEEATLAVLRKATDDPASDLGRALALIVAFAADQSFEALLGEALMRRDWLEEATRLAFARRTGLDAANLLYREALGAERGDTPADLEAARASVLAKAQLTRARDVLRTGTVSDARLAEVLAEALAAPTDRMRAAALAGFFLTSAGEPRARLMTVKLANANPDLHAALTSAQSAYATLTARSTALLVADATTGLMRIAHAVMQHYFAAKSRRAALDFEDLIQAASRLLRQTADAQWVLYKLDGGLDHILVDEAQDTSPPQWRVVEALAREFFLGGSARELATGNPRTVFAVGDEKQSIYGFQGAAPKMFAEMGARFERLAQESRLAFASIPLTLSFRTVAPVLDAVDRVFADPARSAGLTSTGEVPTHTAHRTGMAGLVELWDPEIADDGDLAPVWQPLAEVAASPPQVRLAERIAATIDDWLTRGERLASEDRPITAGDILILVRRRRPFADLMVAALKHRRIAVAGADRLALADQLAVQDLMALCDVILVPEDDLALAGVLKSPLIGLDDDDLLALAPGRRGSLWTALLAAADGNPRLAEAAERLKRWRTRADIVPPYEFLVEVLVHDGMRQRLLARLGLEAADPIDELLDLALAFDEEAPPSLQGFMAWLRSSEREIKRDMEHGRNEVRVMTVHGSKGLEAPIVFLPDTCAAPAMARGIGLVAFDALLRPNPEPEPFVWPLKGSRNLPAVQAARASLAARETEEHSRLLYVALTRARDRLYVAGFETGRSRARGCWYEHIEQGLEGALTASTDTSGRRIRRLESPQAVPAKAQRAETGTSPAPVPTPDWARRPAPREPGLAIPLAPSRLAPLDIDAEGDPVEPRRATRSADEPPAPSPRRLADGHRFLRGTLTHALLQHLPSVPPAEWEAVARAFVAAAVPPLGAGTRESIVAETLAVLRHPEFGAVFGPSSRAEVPIAAVIPPPGGSGAPVRITGQIDRLLLTDEAALIVDFKTNRPPPREVAAVPEAYLLQLAAYRLAVARIVAPRPVRAALLWTDGPHLMELPPASLDDATRRLFKLSGGTLDG